jgi:hypothetical protein
MIRRVKDEGRMDRRIVWGVALAASISLFGGSPTAALAQITTIDGVDFKVRSATIDARNPNLIVTLSAVNKNKDSVGLVIYSPDTTASLDSGYTYHGSDITHIAGSGRCGSGNDRSYCAQHAQSDITTVPGGGTDNIIIEFQGIANDAVRRSVQSATLADLTAVIYMTAGNGEAGYVPLSFADLPLRKPK